MLEVFPRVFIVDVLWTEVNTWWALLPDVAFSVVASPDLSDEAILVESGK